MGTDYVETIGIPIEHPPGREISLGIHNCNFCVIFFWFPNVKNDEKTRDKKNMNYIFNLIRNFSLNWYFWNQ